MWPTPSSLYYLHHLRSCACGASGSNTSGGVSGALDICLALPWNTTYVLTGCCFPSAPDYFTWASFDAISPPLELPALFPVTTQHESFPLILNASGALLELPFQVSEICYHQKYAPREYAALMSSRETSRDELLQSNFITLTIALSGILMILATCRILLKKTLHCSGTSMYCSTVSTLNVKLIAGAAAWYEHLNGTVEKVTVVKVHSISEGGGCTIWVPSLGREKQTVLERLVKCEGLNAPLTSPQREGSY